MAPQNWSKWHPNYHRGSVAAFYHAPLDELVRIGGESKGYEAVLSSLHPDLRPAQSQLFTTFNGSHTRWEAIFPGIEVSHSTLQCKFPPFAAKLVHPSVNLPHFQGGFSSPDEILSSEKVGPRTA